MIKCRTVEMHFHCFLFTVFSKMSLDATLDCYAVLHMHIVTSNDACAAARAAIRAAEIQGKASRYAGTFSLLAGILALIGGGFTIIATRMLIRQKESEDRNTRKKRVITLVGLLKNSLTDFGNYKDEVNKIIDAVKAKNHINDEIIYFTEVNKTSFIVNIFNIIPHQNWDSIPELDVDSINSLISISHLISKTLEEISDIEKYNRNLNVAYRSFLFSQSASSNIDNLDKNMISRLNSIIYDIDIIERNINVFIENNE